MKTAVLCANIFVLKILLTHVTKLSLKSTVDYPPEATKPILQSYSCIRLGSTTATVQIIKSSNGKHGYVQARWKQQ